ncbi:hypothetical protein FB645_002014 [Coemansia sp. IMI 203386]|nr:hypothetical protein FB645_002014 [Coemansia sp. IMI 203386]
MLTSAFAGRVRVAAFGVNQLRHLSTQQNVTPMLEVETRVFGKAPKRSKKFAKMDNLRIREQLRRLKPKLEATGSFQTDLIRPTQMLDHCSSNLTLESMMAAGMHLGHCASLWNPMNLPYIFGEREGIHIINLEQTMAALRRAAHFARSVAYNGGLVLFVGSRKDHRQMAVDAALHSEQYFVTGKWIPGTLTNPRPLLGKHVMYVEDIWDVEEAREFADHKPQSTPEKSGRGGNNRYLKMIEEEKAKLKKEHGDLKTYKPDLIIALNPLECKTMLAESRLAHVPTIGIVDTNCDPRAVTYPIPCNDDSNRAVSIVAGVLARAAKDGMDLRRAKLRKAVEDHNKITMEIASSQQINLNETDEELE